MLFTFWITERLVLTFWIGVIFVATDPILFEPDKSVATVPIVSLPARSVATVWTSALSVLTCVISVLIVFRFEISVVKVPRLVNSVFSPASVEILFVGDT